MSHLPKRPSWDCDTCPGGKPWPCDPAREKLATEYSDDRVGLSIHLGDMLAHAIREQPRMPPQELFERFVSWTR